MDPNCNKNSMSVLLGIKRRRCVLVLGSGRSGSSATSRVLNFLGCELPKNLIPSDNKNQRGYFEPSELVKLNAKIINKYLTYSEPRIFNIKDIPPSELSVAVEKISKTISDEYKNSALFVLKDPRVSTIFPLYVRALRELKIEPLIAFPVRVPSNVGMSKVLQVKTFSDIFKNSDDYKYNISFWVEPNLVAEKFSRGLKRVFFRYEYLLQDPWRCAKFLAQNLEIPLPSDTSKIEQNIKDFITPDLRHNDESDADFFADKKQLKIVKDTFRIFNDMCSGKNEKLYYEPLDLIFHSYKTYWHDFKYITNSYTNDKSIFFHFKEIFKKIFLLGMKNTKY